MKWLHLARVASRYRFSISIAFLTKLNPLFEKVCQKINRILIGNTYGDRQAKNEFKQDKHTMLLKA